MLIVDITYTAPLSAIEQHLSAHRAFLQKHYDAGSLIASGPKTPRTGGIIVANIDRTAMEALIQQDPFYLAGIADYSITVFDPVKHSAAFQACLAS